jgi:hypothetical protein
VLAIDHVILPVRDWGSKRLGSRRATDWVPVRGLADWLGPHDLPIAITGPSGAWAITLTRGQEAFTIE